MVFVCFFFFPPRRVFIIPFTRFSAEEVGPFCPHLHDGEFLPSMWISSPPGETACPNSNNIKVAGCSLRSKHRRLVKHPQTSAWAETVFIFVKSTFIWRKRRRRVLLSVSKFRRYFCMRFYFSRSRPGVVGKKSPNWSNTPEHGSQPWESEQKMANKHKCTLGWGLGVSQDNKVFRPGYLNAWRVCLLPGAAYCQRCPAEKSQRHEIAQTSINCGYLKEVLEKSWN